MMAKSSRPQPENERILVRGVNWLGDAVMSIPALMRLREARPKAEIVLLTPAKLAQLWLNHPAIDSIIALDQQASLWSVARTLRERRFQIGLVFPNSPRSALEAWLAGVPQRIGYAARWRRHFLTTAITARLDAVPMRKRSLAEIQRRIQNPTLVNDQPIARPAHHVFHYLHLVEKLGARAEPIAPVLAVSAGEIEAFRQRFPSLTVSDRPWFGMNPGAEYGPAKRWPMESFVAAGLEIQQKTNCRWLILGGKGDIELASQLAEGLRRAPSNMRADQGDIVNLAGTTGLRELCVALKLCRVLLTNDTGPMHVAAALGTPVVVPFGSTSPELTGPGLPGEERHRLLKSTAPCSPCFLRECPIDFRCMHGITIESVVEAALAGYRRD